MLYAIKKKQENKLKQKKNITNEYMYEQNAFKSLTCYWLYKLQ